MNEIELCNAAMDMSILLTLGEGHDITAQKIGFWIDCLNIDDTEEIQHLLNLKEDIESCGVPYDTCCLDMYKAWEDAHIKEEQVSA